jgi:hypothetical protein
MLRLLMTALLLSAFATVMVGCHASGSIGTESGGSMQTAK